MQEYGYGINYTKITWKEGVEKLLVKTAVEKTEYIRKMYEEFRSNTDDVEKTAEDFARQYGNGMFLWGDVAGLLCDIINEIHFYGRPIFQIGDQHIYVPAYIPVNEKDKAVYPTREQISSILSEYLGSLAVSCPEAEWLSIQL